MEVITYTVTPEENGVCVRHILKAKLHFSTPVSYTHLTLPTNREV